MNLIKKKLFLFTRWKLDFFRDINGNACIQTLEKRSYYKLALYFRFRVWPKLVCNLDYIYKLINFLSKFKKYFIRLLISRYDFVCENPDLSWAACTACKIPYTFESSVLITLKGLCLQTKIDTTYQVHVFLFTLPYTNLSFALNTNWRGGFEVGVFIFFVSFVPYSRTGLQLDCLLFFFHSFHPPWVLCVFDWELFQLFVNTGYLLNIKTFTICIVPRSRKRGFSKRSPLLFNIWATQKVKRGQCVSISATIKGTKAVLRLYCINTKLKVK